MSKALKDILLSLVGLGIGHGSVKDSRLTVHGPDSVDWMAVKALAEKQGLSAIVLDGLNKVHGEGLMVQGSMPQMLRLEWIGEVLQYEQRYAVYEKNIRDLAAFYRKHGIRMMVLKGYGMSRNYPIPNHRLCGDLDIYLFGDHERADKLIEKELGVNIDNSHHHHTVFQFQGETVENHYDFLNVHHHKSNVELEAILKDLGKDASYFVEVKGEKVYLPSANLHALFLLRHSMSNFASTGFQLRQLLDWAFFVEKHGEEIDWDWLESQLEHFGMKELYDVFNAICVEDLGFSVKLFPQVQFQPQLKKRELNDILTPEFSEKESGGLISHAVFKYRRWKANAWKHELCFNDSRWSAFWSGVWGHLMKPGMI